MAQLDLGIEYLIAAGFLTMRTLRRTRKSPARRIGTPILEFEP
jgi:hypothetical protein